MIAITDYGVGNLFSLQSSFKAIGCDVRVSGEPDVLRAADRIILPGVGAFSDAAEKLKSSGLGEVVIEEAAKGKPLLGICLGMQLLFDKDFEFGVHDGLGIIPGEIRPIADVVPAGLKIPHMGWNSLEFTGENPIYSNIHDGDFVYFVHSYYAVTSPEYVTAVTRYGAPLTASVRKGNVFGCQFHPEKSGTVGLNILRGFAEVKA